MIPKVKNRVIEGSYHGEHREKVFYPLITFFPPLNKARNMSLAFYFIFHSRIIDSQKYSGWKGSLEMIYSSPPAQQGHLE